MSHSDDEDVVASPELGAFKAKKVRDSLEPPSSAEDTGSGAEAPESEEEEQPAEEEEQAKKRTRKKDTRPWTLLNTWDRSQYEPEDLEHCLFTACKDLMEVTRLYRLSTTKSKPKDIALWKHNTDWTACQGKTLYSMYRCPVSYRFGYDCELKVCRREDVVTLEMRGTHDADSHAPEKDKSKFLKFAQIDAIRQA